MPTNLLLLWLQARHNLGQNMAKRQHRQHHSPFFSQWWIFNSNHCDSNCRLVVGLCKSSIFNAHQNRALSVLDPTEMLFHSVYLSAHRQALCYNMMFSCIIARDSLLFFSKCVKVTTFARRTFRCSAPVVWNSQPKTVLDSGSALCLSVGFYLILFYFAKNHTFIHSPGFFSQ